jgi:hypothetical protein
MKRYFLHKEIELPSEEGATPESIDLLIYADEYKVLETELGKKDFPVAPIFAIVQLLRKDIKYVTEDEVCIFSDTLSKESFNLFLLETLKPNDIEGSNLLASNEDYYYFSTEEYRTGVEMIRDSAVFRSLSECDDMIVLSRCERLIAQYQLPLVKAEPVFLFTGTREEYADFLGEGASEVE